MKFKRWILVAQPWALPASASPAIIAMSYAFYLHSTGVIADINWTYGVIALLGAMIFHLSGNILGDYHDFMNGVDVKEKTGPIRPLVFGYLKPRQALIYGYSVLFVGVLIGIFLLVNMEKKLPLLIIGIVGLISTTLYHKFKYIALGDILIFICYALAISFGMVYVMSGQLVWQVLLIITPVGLLIVAILHANNTRDMLLDKAAGIRTQAMNLGVEGSQVMYQTLLLVTYIIIAILVMLGFMSSYTFLVLLSFPLAIKNIKLMKQATMEDLGIVRFLDTHTAQLVLIFSLLQVAGNVIAALV